MSLTYNNILVAIDGSDQADRAFRKAMEMARGNKSKLFIAHVFDVRVYPVIYAAIDTKARSDGEDLLERYAQRAKEEGLEVETIGKQFFSFCYNEIHSVKVNLIIRDIITIHKLIGVR